MIKRVFNIFFMAALFSCIAFLSACGTSGEGTKGSGKAELKVTFAPAGSTAVLSGFSGKIISSTDFTNWNVSTSGIDPSDTIVNIKHLNGIYIALSANGSIYTSTDGAATWEKHLTGTGNLLKDVAYNGTVYVAVGFQGTLLTSSDARNWTIRNLGISGSFVSVSFGAGSFVAIEGNPSSALGFITSVDGINWTPHNSINSGDEYGNIIYANNKFITCTTSGKVYTSASGIGPYTAYNITIADDPITAAVDPFIMVAMKVAHGNGVTVVLGFNPNDPTRRILTATSTNLTTWVLGTSPPAGSDPQNGPGYDIQYNANFAAFVAVHISTPAALYTSTDGSNWVQRELQQVVVPPPTTPIPTVPNGVVRLTVDALPDNPTHFTPTTLDISSRGGVNLSNLYDGGRYTIIISGYNLNYEKTWEGKASLIIQSGVNQIAIDVTPYYAEQADKAFKTADFTNKIFMSSTIPADANMLFNPNGTITWSGLPMNIQNGLWKVRADGSLVKYWTDTLSTPTQKWGVYKIVSNFKPVYILEGLRSDGVKITDTLIDMSQFSAGYEGRYILYGSSTTGGKVSINVNNSGLFAGSTTSQETIEGMLTYFTSTELALHASGNKGSVVQGKLNIGTKQITGTWSHPTEGSGGFSMASTGTVTVPGKAYVGGIVVDPDMTSVSNLISNADVKAYEKPADPTGKGVLIKSVKTDNSGYYEITGLDTTKEYYFEFSKQNFETLTYYNIIPNGSEQFLNTVRLIPNSWTSPMEKATVSGTIRNATDGSGLPNMTIKLRKGIANQLGTVETTGAAEIITNASGVFTITALPVGIYTAEISGLIGTTPITPTYFTLYSMKNPSASEQMNLNQDFSALSSAGGAGEYRIILNWGSEPSDLDSHLTGPTENPDTRFHVYYGVDIYPITSPYNVYLDVDNTSHGSFNGPETITIVKSTVGTYNYYVHHFSGTGNISTSGATVQLYKGTKLVDTFYPPANALGNGDVWSVFSLEKSTSGIKVISINSIATGSGTSYLAKPVANSSFDSALLFSRLPLKR